MNRRIVLGTLVAVGLGVGIFSAAERALRGAAPVSAPAPVAEPESPVELVTRPPRPAAPKPPPNLVAAVVARAIEAEPASPAARQSAPGVAAAGVGPKVDRLTVCTSVRDKEPAGEFTRTPSRTGKIYAWMKVSNAKGMKVRPVWTLNGRRSTGAWATIPAAAPYRTWAMKKIDTASVGAGKVEIQDEKGRVLASQAFEITRK